MTGRCAWIVWHRPLELDHLARHTDDSPEGCLPLFYGRSLSLCTCSDAAPNACSSSHAPGSKQCVPVPASSRRMCPPHVHGSRILQNRSMLTCQESSSKSPNSHQSILQLPGLPGWSSSNFPSHCPLRRCQDQRWSSGVNPQGLVQSQLQSPESFSLNLKDLDQAQLHRCKCRKGLSIRIANTVTKWVSYCEAGEKTECVFLKPNCISSRKGTVGGRTMAAPWHRLLSLPNAASFAASQFSYKTPELKTLCTPFRLRIDQARGLLGKNDWFSLFLLVFCYNQWQKVDISE